MAKNISEMSDRELLEELVKAKRRDDRINRITLYIKLGVRAVILVLCAMYLPKIYRAVSQYLKYTKAVYEAITGIEEKLKVFGDIDTESFKSTFEKLAEFADKFTSFFGG